MNSTDTSLFFFNDWTANQDGIFSENLSLSQAWNRALLKILKAKITQCFGLWPKTQGFFLQNLSYEAQSKTRWYRILALKL